MRVIVVRHYKTLGNRRDEIIGWGESPPAAGWLTDVLYVQRKLAATDFCFDQLITSDLSRARNTGRFFALKFGIKNVSHESSLNEINYGKLGKKSKKWVEQHVPAYKTDPAFVFPGGESFLQLQARCTGFLQSLAASSPDSCCLIVAHAGVIRACLCHFLALDYAANLKRTIGHRYIGDFRFSGRHCSYYNELGAPSGFVNDAVIHPPVTGDGGR